MRTTALTRGLESNNAEQLTSVLIAMGMPGHVLHVEVNRSHDVSKLVGNKIGTITGIGNHVHWECLKDGIRFFKVSGIGEGWFITNDVLKSIYNKVEQEMPSFSVNIPPSLSRNCSAIENKLQGSSAMDSSLKAFSMSTTHTSSISSMVTDELSSLDEKKRPLVADESREESSDMYSMDVSESMPISSGSNSGKNEIQQKKKKEARTLKQQAIFYNEEKLREKRCTITSDARANLGLVDVHQCSIDGCNKSFLTSRGKLFHENTCKGPSPPLRTRDNFVSLLRKTMQIGNSQPDIKPKKHKNSITISQLSDYSLILQL